MRALLVAGIVAAAGCGGGGSPPRPAEPTRAVVPPTMGDPTDALAAVARLYLDFQKEKGRPPADYGELAGQGLDRSSPLPPAAGALEVVWGAGLGPLADAPAAAVAWTRPRPDGTRLVLTADGTTTELTADAFGTVDRAKPRNR